MTKMIVCAGGGGGEEVVTTTQSSFAERSEKEKNVEKKYRKVVHSGFILRYLPEERYGYIQLDAIEEKK